MKIARSKMPARGQVRVPVEIRERLGWLPGAVLEWSQQGNVVSVRRVAGQSSYDVHRIHFPDGIAAASTLSSLKDGIRSHINGRHAPN
jgi:bifunctional DNA-binding transcriptional regulator/antitoxin component of YhaV-PrlF toxin-antitoxin module